ncbi:unnamed protein product [Pieris brassicae]|uniref:PiggyBac transposable element-derived protein domain-containing protein n=1 Tax=Pieris brassicae TaxID=7116 RepID=A0A9P0T043_PIEBR|nr:unnamed protein product [Pieris brassicae]
MRRSGLSMFSYSLRTIRQNGVKDAANKLQTENTETERKRWRKSYCQVVCNKNKLSIVKWFDNKQVTLVSSFDDAYPVENIKRFRKEAKSRVDVKCPKILKDYNRHMGGVDLADMLIALYDTGI